MNIKLVDSSLLESIFLAKESEFNQIKRIVNLGTTNDPLYYLDNNSPVLGVAHLDSVIYGKCTVAPLTDDDSMVVSPMCDDRLGVYTILALLPKIGIKTDILFTTNEEIMQSTAKDFKKEKDYNWMYMFDRSGIDAVHYQYTDQTWLKALREAGFNHLNHGSYSDIADLDNLGCCGVNIGTGYYNQHTPRSFAYLSELLMNVKTFARFYAKNKDIKFPYIQTCRFCGKPTLKTYCDECSKKFYYPRQGSTYYPYNSVDRTIGKWDENDIYYDTNYPVQRVGKSENTYILRDGKVVKLNSDKIYCDICGEVQDNKVSIDFVKIHDGLCADCHIELRCLSCGKNPHNPDEYDRLAYSGYCESCYQVIKSNMEDNNYE